jgi:hypothetical protein
MSDRLFNGETEAHDYLRSVGSKFAAEHPQFDFIDQKTTPEAMALVSEGVAFRLSYDIRDNYLSIRVFEPQSFYRMIETKNPFEYLQINDSASEICSYSDRISDLLNTRQGTVFGEFERRIMEALELFVAEDFPIRESRSAAQIKVYERRTELE